MQNTKLSSLEPINLKCGVTQNKTNILDEGKFGDQMTTVENNRFVRPIGQGQSLEKEMLDIELFESHLLGFSGNG